MKRILLCLLIAAGCETKAAELAPGFVSFDELDRTAAARIEVTIRQLPIETLDAPRLDFMPRSLGEARRLIEHQLDRQLKPFAEACDTRAWVIFSQESPDADARFQRGWALERSSLKLYRFGSQP